MCKRSTNNFRLVLKNFRIFLEYFEVCLAKPIFIKKKQSSQNKSKDVFSKQSFRPKLFHKNISKPNKSLPSDLV